MTRILEFIGNLFDFLWSTVWMSAAACIVIIAAAYFATSSKSLKSNKRRMLRVKRVPIKVKPDGSLEERAERFPWVNDGWLRVRVALAAAIFSGLLTATLVNPGMFDWGVWGYLLGATTLGLAAFGTYRLSR